MLDTQKSDDVALPPVSTIPETEEEAGLNAAVIKHCGRRYNGARRKDFLCLECLKCLTRGLALGMWLHRWCVKCACSGETCEPVPVMGSSLRAIPSEAGGQAGRRRGRGNLQAILFKGTASPPSSL